MRELKQSTAYDLMVFMTDSADHVSGKTGLTLTITASKAGAAFASISPTVTERGTGWYALALTTSHTDTLGDLAIHVTSTGADPTDLAAQVRANILGDTLPANVTQLVGVSQSATDLKDFADDGYDPSTNKVTGVVLTDTVTTYTGNTVQTGDAFGRIGLAGVGLSNVPWNASWDTEVQSEVNDGLIAFFGSVAAIVDAVWDEVLGGHLTAGTTGAGLNAAGSAGDPWSTVLPGAYGATTAGGIIGNNINATISSRSSHSAADVWAAGTRTLTAGTNIALAKGTGVTGFNDIAAADVWSVGTRTITGGTVSTNSDKTGYALSSSGLDAISVTAPAGVASTFPSMVVQLWRRFFKKATKSATEIQTFADNGTTVVTTQTISAVGDDETQGAAT